MTFYDSLQKCRSAKMQVFWAFLLIRRPFDLGDAMALAWSVQAGMAL
jgi:hypothetical protein